ncbi:MAG: ribosome-binding factor A [Patescibacteria group bacterium]
MRERLIEALQQAASEFINRESNRRSMITVTKVVLDRRGMRADIFVSVFPEKETHAATDFLNRQRSNFSDYLKSRLRVRALPHVTFLADPVVGGTIEPVETTEKK